jgi:hypothetical protein
MLHETTWFEVFAHSHPAVSANRPNELPFVEESTSTTEKGIIQERNSAMNRKKKQLMSLSLFLALASVPLVPTTGFAQCPDTDGDGIPGAIVSPGRLEVNEDAALEGNCGLEVLADGTTDNRWVKDESPTNETVYRASFLINMNDFAFNGPTAAKNKHLLFACTAKNGAGKNEAAIRVTLKKKTVRFVVSASSENTAGDRSRHTPGVTLEAFADCCSTHRIEVEWQKASGAGTGDGIIRVRVDGGAWAERTTVKSAGQEIFGCRLGAFTAIDSESTGSYYLDDFQSFRTLAP